MNAKPLIPIPKVLVPFAASLIGMCGAWIATGAFSRLELAMLVTGAGYAAIGWLTPDEPGVQQVRKALRDGGQVRVIAPPPDGDPATVLSGPHPFDATNPAAKVHLHGNVDSDRIDAALAAAADDAREEALADALPFPDDAPHVEQFPGNP